MPCNGPPSVVGYPLPPTPGSETTPEMTLRTNADIQRLREQGGLTTAEETLIENCRAGLPTLLEDGEVPDGPSDARTIRADLLRYLITGGCAEYPTRDAGVLLVGAYVSATLDLNFATTKGTTGLVSCRFERGIIALQASFEFLNLRTSHLPWLFSQGLQVSGHVFLQGASLKGKLDLSDAAIGGQLNCTGARLEVEESHALNAQGLQVNGDVFLNQVHAEGQVNISGTRICGVLSCRGARFESSKGLALNAERARVSGSVFLQEVRTKGEFRLSAIRIGGQVICEGAKFDNADGKSLNAQGAHVMGGFILKGIISNGELSLFGACIGGPVECDGARFEALEGIALNAQSIEAVALFWRGVKQVRGSVTLVGASVDELADDAASWDLVKSLSINRFCYAHIHGPMEVRMRLDWVRRGSFHHTEFWPQPHAQLAQVLHAMGHEAARRVVLIEKERLQREHERMQMHELRRYGQLVAQHSRFLTKDSESELHEFEVSAGVLAYAENDRLRKLFRLLHVDWPLTSHGTIRPDPEAVIMAQAGFREEIFWNNARLGARIVWSHVKDRAFQWLAGYGYQPFNFIWALLLLLGIGWFMAYQAWHAGDFAPNSDVILSTPEWQSLADGAGVDNPAEKWSAKYGNGRDWETFNAGAYSFDVVVPIVTIGQNEAWAPSTTRGPWGWHLWWARWILTVLGWIVTAVGAAAITGIIRRE